MKIKNKNTENKNTENTKDETVKERRKHKINYRQHILRRRKYWKVRRFQDILFSGIALCILAPFMLLVAIIIWLDDPHGSPFFSQIRVGKDCEEFRMYKFRSMYKGSEERLKDLMSQNEMDGPAFKIKNDPRITRVGKFIRKTSIDELPQLINILKGDMSIVGPRPALPGEVAQYKDYWKRRFWITPGLTCIWQIQPHRNDIPFEEWVDMDLKYIQKRNFWLDWWIILRTILVVFRGQGE